MNGRLVTCSELRKHIQRGFDSDLVTRHASAAEKHPLELLVDMVIGIPEFPSFLVRQLAHKSSLELLQAVLDALVLKNPCTLDSTKSRNDLIPHDEFIFLAEAFQQ